MFFTVIKDSSGWLAGVHPVVLVLLSSIIAVGVLCLGFRLWAFTIKPAFRPYEPRELPYWIPVLGHAVQYVKSGQDVITRARKYFGDTRAPFALTLGGEKMFFLTDPKQVADFHKNTTSLAFDKIAQELSTTFGVSQKTLQTTYRRPNSEEVDVPAKIMQIQNPRNKSLAELNNDFWKQQLVPGPLYYKLQDECLQYLDNSLKPESIAHNYKGPTDEKGTTVSLLRLMQDVLMDAALRAFFGDKMMELEPNLIRDFIDFDEDNWKLWYKWPDAKEMFAAKSKLSKSVQRWLNTPEEERPGAAFIVETFEKTQRAMGTPIEDLANILVLIIFVANTNTYKVCFWALAYILNDPDLLHKVQQESAAAFQADGTLSTKQLMDSSPWIAAVFHEALRWCSASTSLRLVTAPTIIGGKELPVGSRVAVPARQTLFMPEAFGDDADVFNPERFIRDEKLTKSPSYKPFGGGTTYCPGRFIARQECSVVIAILLKNFNTDVLGEGKAPELDLTKPTTGLVTPKDGQDVIVRLSPKSEILP
ncbi:cytochrome P450 [Aaosphaeria arxii CBS 175.79]|uniref:Cytochrome P450 n=1 Tax=Aaosphaeria arxii CBS 175.79 TaxID=1450172 RepID=A0A6A5XPI8_9PLEO|nr:cytochrome P450 [Aaosphaeria arxii CBS 175.79]KAF2014264.1 cytochrome P450 [Aaosphaeria arxii CBS 175.79]